MFKLRRLLQFRLGTLLLAVAAVACFLAWRLHDPERAAVDAITRAGGRVHLSHHEPSPSWSFISIATLPEFVCAPAITHGELEVVLPAWSMPQGTMHFVYPSRRGQLPGVRAFVEFLAERLPGAVQLKHEQCMRMPDVASA